MGTMDFIIDTVLLVHPLAPLLSLLKLNGKLITVGLLDKPLELPIFPLVLGKFQHEQTLHCLKESVGPNRQTEGGGCELENNKIKSNTRK